MEPDEYEAAVASAVRSILHGTEDQVTRAMTRLGELNAADVIGEMCLCIEDVTEDVDLDVLITAARLPLPERTAEIVAAIEARDLGALESVTSETDLGAVVQKLLTVIVSLTDARARI